MTNMINVPDEYLEKSKQIPELWQNYTESKESLALLLIDLRQTLIDAGFKPTQAMFKIAEDNKHLRGFSLSNIYKALPQEQKREKQQTPDNSHLKNSIDDKNVIEQSNKQGSDNIEPDNYVKIEKEMTPLTDEEIDKVANEPYEDKPGAEEYIPETNRIAMEPDTEKALIEKQAARINELVRLGLQKDDEIDRLENEVRMLREERSRFKGAIATDDEVKLREENEALREEVKYLQSGIPNLGDVVKGVEFDAEGLLKMGSVSKSYPFSVKMDFDIKESKVYNVKIKMGQPKLILE